MLDSQGNLWHQGTVTQLPWPSPYPSQTNYYSDPNYPPSNFTDVEESHPTTTGFNDNGDAVGYSTFIYGNYLFISPGYGTWFWEGAKQATQMVHWQNGQNDPTQPPQPQVDSVNYSPLFLAQLQNQAYGPDGPTDGPFYGVGVRGWTSYYAGSGGGFGNPASGPAYGVFGLSNRTNNSTGSTVQTGMHGLDQNSVSTFPSGYGQTEGPYQYYPSIWSTAPTTPNGLTTNDWNAESMNRPGDVVGNSGASHFLWRAGTSGMDSPTPLQFLWYVMSFTDDPNGNPIYVGGNDIWDPSQTDSPDTSIAPYSPVAINTPADPAQVQVLANGTSAGAPAAFVFDKEPLIPGGQPVWSTNIPPRNLNHFIASSTWRINTGVALNNFGAIVATATCSGVDPTGVLFPADIKIAASPSNDTNYETDGNGYIPIDGANVNGSQYIMVNGQSTHFPTTPDCNATNLPANDPQLVHLLTKLPAALETGYQAQLTVQNNGRARIRFWKDRKKQQEYVAGTPLEFSSFPKDLYVEGTVPGAAQQEIVLTLQGIVGSQTVNANSIKLTVTPVLTNYQAVFLNTAAPSLYRTGIVWSVYSGPGNANISVVADMMTNNMSGQPQQIQTLSIVNPGGIAGGIYPGNPATTTASRTFTYDFAPPSAGATLVDIVPTDQTQTSDFPFYKFQTSCLPNVPSANSCEMSIQDNPGIPVNPIYPQGSQVTALNLVWNYTDYVVWVYPDGTAYPLGQTTWSIDWAGNIGVGPPTSYLWAPSSNNANNVGQAYQLINSVPTLSLPSAYNSLRGTGGGFQ